MDFDPNLHEQLFGPALTDPLAQTKRRIRAYSPEYYEWIGDTTAPAKDEDDIFAPQPELEAQQQAHQEPVAQPATEMPPAKTVAILGLVTTPDDAQTCDHPSCKGRGHVYIAKYGKYVPCGRCRGTGLKVERTEQLHRRYMRRKDSGKRMDITFENHIRH